MIGTRDHSRMRVRTSRPSMSGRPRSRITRSGWAVVQSRMASLPVCASMTVYSCELRLADRKRRICGSSSTTRIRALPLIGIGRLLERQGGRLAGDRKADLEGGAAPKPLAFRRDGPAMRLDDALADGQPQAGSRDLPVLRAHAVEFVEDALQLLGRNPRALVRDDQHHLLPGAVRADGDRRARVRVL